MAVESDPASLEAHADPPPTAPAGFVSGYLRKLAGAHRDSPAPAPWQHTAYSTAIAIVSLVVVFNINRESLDNLQDVELLLGSFGASSVLVYHAIESPMAQPMNVVAGHALSAVVGVAIAMVVPESMLWLAGPVSVGLAIAVMALTNTTHPPGGATALTAVIGSDHLRSLGFYYVLQPVLTGAVAMVICAVLLNNLHPQRQYPLYWVNQVRRQRTDGSQGKA
ncbi:HPP family protein [Plasmodiophora brassicae]|nr:hypothetical protein PBRA_005586 [Plasmodiophora brassicae]